MVLVDTSIWVDHLHHGVPDLVDLLHQEQVACHPFVIGELACGQLRNREEVFSLLSALQAVPTVADGEVLDLIERHRLMGMGLGLIDVHLLASCMLTGTALWTRDRKLAQVASRLDVQFNPT